MEQTLKKSKRTTFTEQLRALFKWFLEPVAGVFARWGVHPNTLTMGGLVGTSVAAFFVGQGQISLGGFLFLLMSLVDALDGSLARMRGEPEDFGAFVDSVSDRYSELVTKVSQDFLTSVIFG